MNTAQEERGVVLNKYLCLSFSDKNSFPLFLGQLACSAGSRANAGPLEWGWGWLVVSCGRHHYMQVLRKGCIHPPTHPFRIRAHGSLGQQPPSPALPALNAQRRSDCAAVEGDKKP